MKKIIITLLAIAAVAVAITFFYRYEILRYSAETIIRKFLPDYVQVDKIDFDARGGKVVFEKFRILNPPDFSYNFLIEIESISCSYKMKGKNILDGLEISDPVFKKPVLTIERLSDGRINLQEMGKILEKTGAVATTAPVDAVSNKATAPVGAVRSVGGKKISEVLKLPETFHIKSGKVIFIDRLAYSKPHMITFENVEADLSMKLDADYAKVLRAGSEGSGNLNGDKTQILQWTVVMDPTTPGLSMSNRFIVTTVDIVTFEPYYDKYSPFVFKKGRFSGTLIFDFDNGSIGSTNEIRLSDFQFYIKKEFENAQFWGTTVQDLAKYFTSPYGEIVFDFKIKGNMKEPQFFFGPITKQALMSAAIDKGTELMQQFSGGPEAGAGAGGAKSDIDKAKQYIDLFKGLMEKK